MTCRSRVARDLVTPQPRLLSHCYEFFFALHYCCYNLISSTAYYHSNESTLSSSYHACQSFHSHSHGTLPHDRLETRVAMIPVDQTNKAYRLNVGRDLGGVQSMSMVITQPFVDYKKAVECQLTYLVFCIASKPLSTRR